MYVLVYIVHPLDVSGLARDFDANWFKVRLRQALWYHEFQNDNYPLRIY